MSAKLLPQMMISTSSLSGKFFPCHFGVRSSDSASMSSFSILLQSPKNTVASGKLFLNVLTSSRMISMAHLVFDIPACSKPWVNPPLPLKFVKKICNSSSHVYQIREETYQNKSRHFNGFTLGRAPSFISFALYFSALTGKCLIGTFDSFSKTSLK